MAVYAFDGTWNEDEAESVEDTNVVKFLGQYTGKTEYIEGVGTRFGALGRFFGGVFGAGGKTRIEEMYERLAANWQAGDEDIDIIGFSRGAALAVHFANVIGNVGIKIGDDVVAEPPVRFLGVWDVVGSFGIPINFVLNFQDINIGYDLAVAGNVENCFHAMSLDERRQTFRVTRLDKGNDKANVAELWFRGVHSDVGGGNKNTELSNITLKWMLERAIDTGLPIADGAVATCQPQDPTAPLGENFDPVQNPKRKTFPSDGFHPTAVGKVLAEGDSDRFTVRAAEQYSWSGIRLEKGAHYAFSVPDGEQWTDKTIVCGADGWQTEDLPWYKEEIVELLEFRRRCPKANWFELIGTLGDDEEEFFRIGRGGNGATYRASDDGELYAFANDLRTMYGNNHGEITVEVTRVAGPGAERLKTCNEA